MLQRIECITSDECFQYLKSIKNTIRYNAESREIKHEDRLVNRRDNTTDGKVFKSDELHWEESEYVTTTIYREGGKVKVSCREEYSTKSEQRSSKTERICR